MLRDKTSFRVIAVAAAALMLTGVASGEVSISLDGAPEVLRIPVPYGVNSILTAKITGGEVKGAWLGLDGSQAVSTGVQLAKVAEGEYQINLSEKSVLNFLKGNAKEGEFRIFAETPDGKIAQSVSIRYTTSAVPKKLELPWEEAKIALYQRSITDLPGVGGSLRVQLGDIAAEQVLVSVFGPNNEIVADLVRMRAGDAMSIALQEARYVLYLDGLYGAGQGRDYGIFTLMPSRTWERGRINRLCDLVEGTDLIFIRDGHMMGSAMFASLMRNKLALYGVKNPSLTGFIDEACTRSETSGEKYRFKRQSGTEGDVAPWLHSVAQEIPTPTRP
jgi:hypothetical protein